MNELVGRTINKVSIGDSNEWIKFDTDKGPIHYQAMGDCCSQSWIEYVPILGTLQSIVLSTDDKYLNEWEENYSTIQAYSQEIKTETGTITIEYRNSSNGYYGGWLEYCEICSCTDWKELD